MKKIYIIMVNYNGIKDTLECIKSIKKEEHKANYSIIVVDNNSTKDNSKEELKKIKDITLIENNENLGFAKANNIGIQYALKKGAEEILLLNNDTIITSNLISDLSEGFSGEKNIGIVSCRIMYHHNKEIINYCGGKFNWLKGVPEHNYNGTNYNNTIPKRIYTDFITGCAMLIKKEVFEKVGLLPEEYFMYFEDADFCMKVRNGGYKLLVLTDKVLYHKEGASSGGELSCFTLQWSTRNRLIFINKYKKSTKGILTKLFFYTTRYIKMLKLIITGDKKRCESIRKGLKEGKIEVRKMERRNNNG